MYRIFRLLSLDIVAGVLSIALYFTTVFDIKMPWRWWVLLPVSVWVIYTSDHILDGAKHKSDSYFLRHLFHYKKRSLLGSIVVALAVVSCMLLVGLDRRIFLTGTLVLLLVTLYFIGIHKMNRSWFFKEFAIAGIYVAALVFGPVIIKEEVNITLLLTMATFFFIVLVNVLCYSWFDYETDKAENRKSMGSILSKESLNTLITWNILLSGLGSCVLLFFLPVPEVIPLILIIITEIWVVIQHDNFQKANRFGVVLDASLLIPGMVVLYV